MAAKITRNKIKETVKAKKAKVAKAPGVIDVIVALLKDGGGTIEALSTKLAKKFPDRKAEGLSATIRVQMNRLPKGKDEGGRGLKVKKDRAEGERQVHYSL
jgi:hypothetical protein